MTKAFPAAVLLLLVPCLFAQQRPANPPAQPAPPAPTIEEYEPRAMLVVPKHEAPRAKFPFIDIHTHQRDTSPAALDKLIADMDKLNMKIMLSSPVRGSFGANTKKYIDGIRAYKQGARFATMTNINYGDLEGAAKQLEEDIKAGAIGVKVWKNLGINEKDKEGKRIAVDDPRLKPVWDIAAKYKTPVMIHTADPKPLFDPMDKYNERWLELKIQSGRANHGGVSWEQLIGEQHNLVRTNPKTTFILAHMGWMAHDLGALGKLMDEMPNMNVEFAAILGELGRQPRAVKRFFTKYQDRILFGKDRYDPAEYPFYFRMLETDDEWIDNIRKYHGLWHLYAFDLPDDVLKKIYYKNALRLFPSLSKAGFPN